MPVEPVPTAAPLADDRAALAAAEEQALQQRRRVVLREAAASNTAEMALPKVGLALSGGGVRSATFALGLLRGLAQSGNAENPGRADAAKRSLVSGGLLGRLDYLSSVSGGGYTAGMFGRLVSAIGLADAQQRLADSEALALEWLRRNGRYLTPAGSRDIGIAIVTFMRSLLAIHVEFMFACICVGLLVIAPHLWQHSLQILKLPGWEPWKTPWWALATAWWLFTAPGLIAGYWAARDGPDVPPTQNPDDPAARPSGWRAVSVRDVLFLLLAALVSAVVLRSLYTNGSLDLVSNALTWPTSAALALVSLVLGQALVQVWLAASNKPWALAVAKLRNQLTRALRAVTLIATAVAGLGVLDRLSWWVLEELQSGNDWLWGGVGFGGLAVLVLRSLMQPLQQIAAEAGAHARDWLPRLLDLAGSIGLLALVVAWLVLLQWFVFAPTTFDAFVGVPAWMRAGLLLAVWVPWVLLTAANSQMANTSSLHSFYRARLTRAYLAVGNPRRGLIGGSEPRTDVTEVVEGDDTRLGSYHPETAGGPIHLVNACLNQTRDDQSGLYNADRKGTCVTATWRGLEVGPDEFIAATPAYDTGTLGRWVAVSGAAASPGAGSYTSRGLALLVYFLGVRLGLWVRAPRQRSRLQWLSRFAWRFLPKPVMLASEASATFFGVERPWWYLSDGGHFENTAVYALLKRELDFIILSDASCDAKYEFGDIENLVRKARIDFGAEIEFYTRDEAASLFSLAGAGLTVLSPEDMTDNHSCRGVLLARIRYRERPGPARADGSPGKPLRPEGSLLVVKPNLHDELDVDLLAYAQKHPDFPHESTGDQSFDEAQWESYHRLGEDFGRALHESWLAQLPGWRRPARHGLKVAARLRSAAELREATKKVAEPLWRRSARATAIGTTLGLGASGTLLVSLWQVQDQLQRRESDEQTEVRQMFTEASKGLQSFDGACPNVPDHVVTQASRLLELRGSPNLRPLEQGGVDRIASRLLQECQKPATDSAACRAASERMHNDLCAQVTKQPAQSSALDYWRPGTTPADQHKEALQTWLQLSAWWRPAAPPVEVAAAGADALPIDTLPAVPAAPQASVLPPPAPVLPAVVAAAPPPLIPPLVLPTTPAPVPAPSASTSRPTSPSTAAKPSPVPSPAPPPPSLAPPPPPPPPPVPATLPTPVAAAAPAPVVPTSAAASAAAVRRSAAAALTASCQPGGQTTTLYVQVYDEDTRNLIAPWRQRLLDLPGVTALQVAPVENVSRGAELRQQRRPVPWPKPTFVLHDPASRPCAEVLARLLRPRATAAKPEGPDDRVWIRGLPDTQPNRRPGVIELWLPTGSVAEPRVAIAAASVAPSKR